MSLVWRKIQRSNKKAAKFRFTATFQELVVHCTNKWQPTKLCVSWVHRRRRYSTPAMKWEPTITDPYKGLIVWPAAAAIGQGAAENNNGGGACTLKQSTVGKLDIETTMYRDSRNESFDDKEWTFIVEEVTNSGKHKPVAGINLNMRLFVQEPGAQTELKLKLKPLRENLLDCRLQLSLSCWPTGPEGDAFDEDMRSVASQMSVQNSAAAAVKESSTIDDFLQQQQQTVVAESKSSPEDNDDLDLISKRIDLDSKNQEPNLSKSTSRELEKILRNLDGSLQGKPASESPDNRAKLAKRQSFLDNQNDTSSDLMTWCKNVTRNYKNVKIDDFSTSWRNGLAFCALVHHFRPDLIDYERLDAKNIYKNCSLAFDTAANLGVAKIISPADMVVLAIPDKIAVMTYVSLLRDLFTCSSNSSRQSCLENLKNRPKSFRNSFTNDADSTKPLSTLKDQKFASEHSTLRSSAENLQKPNLMTRNQLMNPFDSSDEDLTTKKDENLPIADSGKSDQIDSSDRQKSQLSAPLKKEPDFADKSVEQILSPTSSVTGRALKLLEQYEKRPNINDDDENRRQILKERARKLIEDAKSGVLYNSTAASTTTTPPLNVCKTVKMTEVVKPVQYNSVKTDDFTPNQNLMAKSKSFEKSAGTKNDETPPTSVTFENFKRFGSMRGQELVNSVNLLSERLTRTLKNSQSNPLNFPSQEPKLTTQNGAKSDGVESPSRSPPPSSGSKIASPPGAVLSREKILRELELVQNEQKELDKKATQVERQWRQIMQTACGSDQEQSIMNEYLKLLNQRNMLTRREMHFTLLENVDEQEQKFQNVQRQLADLLKIDDSEKTESHKIKIDQLMAELIECVNKRDELMQQLMANEQAQEDEAELANDVMSQSTILMPPATASSAEKESCCLQ